MYSFESLLETSNPAYADVPTQFAAPFNEISSQCSWFTVGVVAKRRELVAAWKAGEEAFREAQLSVLDEATRM